MRHSEVWVLSQPCATLFPYPQCSLVGITRTAATVCYTFFVPPPQLNIPYNRRHEAALAPIPLPRALPVSLCTPFASAQSADAFTARPATPGTYEQVLGGIGRL